MRNFRSCNTRRRRREAVPANREEMNVVVIPALCPKWPVFTQVGGRLKRHTPKHAEWVYEMLAQAAAAKAKPKAKRSHHKKAPPPEAAA